MALNVQELIAAVSPENYFNYGGDKTKLNEFKSVISQKGPYAAAEEFKKKGKLKVRSNAEHELTYDSSADGLEPVYFFMTDLMEFMGFKIEKLIDNFSSSPGSGHFGELGQRSSIMQQQGSKILADMNTVLRSILNLIYDLREFRIRLQAYSDLKDSSKKDVAILSLKQVWMDKVDMAKGNSSIKAMALGQAGFATLIDAFLAAKDVKEAEKIDLNDRVKRILKPRLLEFESWVKESKAELEKRYEIERTYLKSQVSSLKLYSRWAKPYLKAAAELESTNFGRDPALVKVFNTLLLEVTLLGKIKFGIKEAAQATTFPEHFGKDKFLNKVKRQYHICTVLDFRFRGIPNKVPGTQHYSFGGRVEMNFRAYALNDDELKALYKQLDEDDLSSALELIKDITEGSLDQLKDDIEYFVGDGDDEEADSNKVVSNPFSALFGKYEEKAPIKKQSKEEILEVKPDNWYEKEYFRKEAAKTARSLTYKLLDVYKKAHGMPSFTSSY